MKKTIHLLSMLLLVMLIQSCSKENNNSQGYNPKNYYFYLTAAQLSQTPYFTNKAFDTLSFASDKGDTLTFVKTKTDTTWYCERTTSNPDNNDQNCYQTLHNTYTAIKGIGSFDVKHILKGEGQKYDIIAIQISNFNFEIKDYWIDDKNFSGYIENVNIFNNNYKNSLRKTISTNGQDIAFSYINKDFGLFYIEDLTNQSNYHLVK